MHAPQHISLINPAYGKAHYTRMGFCILSFERRSFVLLLEAIEIKQECASDTWKSDEGLLLGRRKLDVWSGRGVESAACAGLGGVGRVGS